MSVTCCAMEKSKPKVNRCEGEIVKESNAGVDKRGREFKEKGREKELFNESDLIERVAIAW